MEGMSVMGEAIFLQQKHCVTQRKEGKNVEYATNEPLVYTVAEAAKQLKLSKSKVYELASQRQIPTVKIGGRVLIPRKQLIEWIDRQLEVGGL
jgi:excisionase family DNA binding protein